MLRGSANQSSYSAIEVALSRLGCLFLSKLHSSVYIEKQNCFETEVITTSTSISSLTSPPRVSSLLNFVDIVWIYPFKKF